MQRFSVNHGRAWAQALLQSAAGEFAAHLQNPERVRNRNAKSILGGARIFEPDYIWRFLA